MSFTTASTLTICVQSLQPCPTLCDPMNRSTPGLPVHHQLPEYTQTHIHWVGDAIQPSHPLSSPSPPAFNLSQMSQGLFKWVCQGCILSPCLYNLYAEYIIQNAVLDEAQAGIKIAGRNNNLRYGNDTTFMAKREEEQRPSWWKWKRRVKKLT